MDYFGSSYVSSLPSVTLLLFIDCPNQPLCQHFTHTKNWFSFEYFFGLVWSRLVQMVLEVKQGWPCICICVCHCICLVVAACWCTWCLMLKIYAPSKQGWHELASPLPAPSPAKQPHKLLAPELQEGHLLPRQKVTLNTPWSGHLDKCWSQISSTSLHTGEPLRKKTVNQPLGLICKSSSKQDAISISKIWSYQSFTHWPTDWPG